MKVVHLSTTDMGGAYEAAQRISDCLKVAGVESEVLVRSKLRGHTKAIPFYNNSFQKYISKVKNFCNLLISDNEVVFDKYGVDICKNPYVQQADVICLHWVNSFVSTKEVRNVLSMGKPVYWIMHDMWPFTGGCHHADECLGYKEGCKKCLRVKPAKAKRIFNWQNEKYNCCSGENLFPIGPSKWITKCAENSMIFGKKIITNIPNPIDVKIFYPKDEEEIAKVANEYGLSKNKRTILFGAVKVTNNPWKGFQYFVEAVEKLPREDYQVLVLGKSVGEDILKKSIKLDVVYTGYVNHVDKLCDIYNVADLLVAPSLRENYSNTVLEALACGTPAVVFDVGGMAELVQTGYNGYLAKFKDADDLAKGITVVSKELLELGKNARTRVEKQNAYPIIAQQYLDLFSRRDNDKWMRKE